METLLHFLAPPSSCGYLPEQTWQLEYQIVAALSPGEYMERLRRGWRRFGMSIFRPRCQACCACQPLRVVVDRFQPDRSQRRARKLNEGQARLCIGEPSVSKAKLALYDRYHAFQAGFRAWPIHEPKDEASYWEAFVNNPIPTEEWCYFLGRRLVGVGYVDALSAGLSAIYFFYDPDERWRSLGTWNVLNVIDEAARRRVPHLYLGYYVAGCRSMQYKARFMPNEVMSPDGAWRLFQGGH